MVGLAGLEGHGQEVFLDVLRGAVRGSGQVVSIDEHAEIPIGSPRQADKHGIAYVPRERAQSIFGWMSIRENFGLPTLRRDTTLGLLRLRRTAARLGEYVKQLGIVFRATGDRITTLSGGNQQKVVIARWLASSPSTLLLSDPTRGIDIGTKREIYRLLTDLANDGLAVVMLSTELDEHVELMDRVLVFREHELYSEIGREDLTRSALVSAFFGQERITSTMVDTE
jgi:ABC-type sugar transport system ATPase subunit